MISFYLKLNFLSVRESLILDRTLNGKDTRKHDSNLSEEANCQDCNTACDEWQTQEADSFWMVWRQILSLRLASATAS